MLLRKRMVQVGQPADQRVLSTVGWGILGADVTAESVLAECVSLPADAAEEFGIEVVSLPAGVLDFWAWPDGSFYVHAPSGVYQWSYRLFQGATDLGIGVVTVVVGVAVDLQGAGAGLGSSAGTLLMGVEMVGTGAGAGSSSGTLDVADTPVVSSPWMVRGGARRWRVTAAPPGRMVTH